jgi:hypothetical protein
LNFQSCWHNDWADKYGRRSDGLPLSQVQRLGRQILEALVFLKERGFPPCCHLHTGNIILQNGVARLSGLENALMGYTSRIQPMICKSHHVIADSTSTDIICFGRWTLFVLVLMKIPEKPTVHGAYGTVCNNLTNQRESANSFRFVRLLHTVLYAEGIGHTCLPLVKSSQLLKT